VLACTRSHLTRISLFAEPKLFERFELPATVAAGDFEPAVGAINSTFVGQRRP
jgi:hypothetical protein